MAFMVQAIQSRALPCIMEVKNEQHEALVKLA